MTALGQLRTIRDDELGLMLTWRNAPAVRANMYTRHTISESEHLEWWKKTADRSDQKYFMYEDDGKPLGIVGFTRIDPLNSNSSWAFYAAPDAPKGTGSRMEYLALDYAFDRMLLQKLHCEVLEFNSAVVGMHQKFGFKVEGVLRNHHKIDSDYVGIVLLGLLADEWRELKNDLRTKLEKKKVNNG